MKLATYKDNTRDGRLHIVSRDMKMATPSAVCLCLQQALDTWDRVVDALQVEYDSLNAGEGIDVVEFDTALCHAPLPRAYQWVDGSAYVSHVELVRKARGATLPESFWHDPLMYQGASHYMIGANDDLYYGEENWGLDMEAEVVVITGDVPLGTSAEDAEKYVRLVGLVNDVSLRGLIPAELAKGFGFLHGKGATAFTPVVATLDELDGIWQDGGLDAVMEVDLNNVPMGRIQVSIDRTFDMLDLIAHASKTRPLCAGTIVGSGTISNLSKNKHLPQPISQGGNGYGCIAEMRCVETLVHGTPKTPFMSNGDTVRIGMGDKKGNSLFGDIYQTAVKVST